MNTHEPQELDDQRQELDEPLQSQEFELLTQAEAAKLLRVSQRHLQRLEERELGPPRTNLGERRIAYPKHRLLAWVRQHTTIPKQV